MNTPVPPTPPSSAALAILQAAANTGSVTQTSGGQPPLQVGETLLATVIARPNAGQFILQTSSGQLTLQTNLNLLLGATVNLQVQAAGARPFVLVSPNPAPSSGGVQAGGTGQPSPAIVTATLLEGSSVVATVLKPASGGVPGSGTTAITPASNPGSQAPVIAGTPPLARSTGGPANGTAPAASSGTKQGASATGGNVPPAGSPPAATPPPGALPAGTSMSVRLLSVTLPGATPSTGVAAHPGSGQVMTGVATGTTASGQTIISSPLGDLSLATRTPLPQGATVTFQQTGLPHLPAVGGEDSMLLSQQWEALRAAMAALQTGDPAAARALAQQALPQSSGNLTTGMLFFLSAMLTGDLRRWMGEEAMRALQRNAPGALDRLRQDFGDLRRMATEPSGQDWRTFLIPLLVGGNLEQIRLFVRGGKDDETAEKDGKDSGTRFVIEVEFSRLGPFQFDGLTRGKSIDLMVRTKEPLSTVMREDIRRIYTNAVSALGFNGTINFQRTQNFEINPTREVYARQSGMTV